MAFKMKGMSFKGSAFKSTYGGTGKGIMPNESIKEYKQRRANERAAEGFGMSYDDVVKAREEGRITSGPYKPKAKTKPRGRDTAITLKTKKHSGGRIGPAKYNNPTKGTKKGDIIFGSKKAISYEKELDSSTRRVRPNKAITLDSKPAKRVTKKRDKVLPRQPRRGTDKAILLDAKTARSVTKPSRNKIQRRKTRPRVSLDINLMDKLNLRKGQGKGTKTRTKTRLVKKRTPKTGGKTGKVFVNLKEMNLLNKMSGSNS